MLVARVTPVPASSRSLRTSGVGCGPMVGGPGRLVNDPLQVVRVPVGELRGDDTRNGVGTVAVHPGDDVVDERGPGVQAHPRLVLVADPVVPAVGGPDRRDGVPAGHDPVVDEGVREVGKPRGVRGGDDDLDADRQGPDGWYTVLSLCRVGELAQHGMCRGKQMRSSTDDDANASFSIPRKARS